MVASFEIRPNFHILLQVLEAINYINSIALSLGIFNLLHLMSYFTHM